MSENPIKYTSRTYTTIINDINSDPLLIDTPNFWKRMIAGLGDVASVYMNAISNQSFLPTAFTRKAVADLLALIDYELGTHETASGTVFFYIDPTAILPFAVPVTGLVGQTIGSEVSSSRRYEALSGETVTAISEAFTDTPASDWITTVRDYQTGEKVRVTTTGTLPPPLAIDTDYYIIRVNSTTKRLAATLSDAYNGTYIALTAGSAPTNTIHLYTISKTLYQQTSVSDINLGTSDGSTEWQKFDLPDLYVLKNTITLSINAVTWTRVDSLLNSLPTDTHFRLRFNSGGASYVMFGNGTYGAIPGNFDIIANYAYGGGVSSNVGAVDTINVYAGGTPGIIGCSNPVALTGGADEESIETAKILAPLLLKARDRFITVEDGESLALNYGGVIRCQVNPNVYGVLSAQVIIVPSGGGLPTAGLKSGLDAYLTARTILNAVDVRVEDPTYITCNVTMNVKVKSGYAFADIEDYIELALRLIFSEVTVEIQDTYAGNGGIAAAITYINDKWAYTFTSADNDQIVELLQNIEPTNFGVDFYESDVTSIVAQYVEGVDYVTTSAPSWPIIVADDEISTEGTMTLVEI